jgi:hypothetical protein
VDVPTFRFGIPGAYAHIHVDHSDDTYIVGVYATHVAYHVQSAGHVVHFTTASDAVQCALDELRGELNRPGDLGGSDYCAPAGATGTLC